MSIPFSHDAFLDVFSAYNTALWPVVAVLWIGTAHAAWVWVRRGSIGRALYGLLAVHWALSGIAYHWFYFRPINPIAGVFSVAFVAQAAAFTWLAMRGTGGSAVTFSPRGLLGLALVLYGLIYPLMGLAVGLRYPRLPVFAVPCPTALVTAGWLLTAQGVPRSISLVPALWGGDRWQRRVCAGDPCRSGAVGRGARTRHRLGVPVVLGTSRPAATNQRPRVSA